MNTELEDRLQALGTHLDAERTAHIAHAAPTAPRSNVVSLDDHRRRRILLAAAVAVLVVAGVAAIALNRGASPDPSTPVTDPTTVESTITPTTVTPTGDVGSLTIGYTVDEGDPNEAVDRLKSRATAMSLDAAVTADGTTITVVVQGITSDAQQVQVTRALSTVADTVQLRPVTADCAVQSGTPLETTSQPGINQQLGILGDPSNQSCEVGPSLGTGSVFEHDAIIQPIDDSTQGVVVSLRPGSDGNDRWNELAGHCYNRDATCPTQQIAVELGGWLYTVATVQTPVFEGTVQMVGAFTELDARALADALNHDDPTFRLTTTGYTFVLGD